MALSGTWRARDDDSAAHRGSPLASVEAAAARRGRRAQARRLNLPGLPEDLEAASPSPPQPRRAPSPELLESLPPHTLAARLLAVGADDAALGLQRMHGRRTLRPTGRALTLAALGLAAVLVVGALLPAEPSANGAANPASTEQPAAGAVPPGGLRVSVRKVETNYTIMPGDTLERIARRFGTTVEALAGMNNLRDYNSLRAGEKLIIP